jgi:hypothetical protein
VACLATGFGLGKNVSRRTGSMKGVIVIAEWSVAYGAFKK